MNTNLGPLLSLLIGCLTDDVQLGLLRGPLLSIKLASLVCLSGSVSHGFETEVGGLLLINLVNTIQHAYHCDNNVTTMKAYNVLFKPFF